MLHQIYKVLVFLDELVVAILVLLNVFLEFSVLLVALLNVGDYLIDEFFVILFHIIKFRGFLLNFFKLYILFFVFTFKSFILLSQL